MLNNLSLDSHPAPAELCGRGQAFILLKTLLCNGVIVVLLPWAFGED